MENTFSKPFVNYFAMPLSESASVLAIEIFDDAGKLVDVELLTPYRADPEQCNLAAIAENLRASERGDHVSQMAGRKAAAA